MHHRLLAAILAALVPGTAAAGGRQAAPPQSAAPLRLNVEVVVTPERGATDRLRVPAATAVVEGADLPSLPVAHASEIISAIPGFIVARPEAHAGRPIVSARGFFGGGEAEYIRLLVDGTPVADLESGLVDWSRLPVSSIARIEAVRGPGAAMYGDSAVGGVIQIFTDRVRSGGTASLLGGAFGTVIGDTSFGRRHQRAGYLLSGVARRSEGAFEHSSGHEIAVNGSVDGQARGWGWRWYGGADTKEREDPGAVAESRFRSDPYGSDPLHDFDRGERRAGAAGASVSHAQSPWTPQARAHVSVRSDDLIRTVLLGPGLGDRRRRQLDALGVDASFQGARMFRASGPLTVRFGTDVARERLDVLYRSVDARGAAGSAAGAASGVRLRGAAFLASSWDAAPRVTVSGALRWDGVGDHDFAADTAAHRAWSPRAGVVVQVREGANSTALFAQFSRAFKVPTLDQLFDPRPYPDFRGGTFTISNRRLVPQRARNVEAGITGTGIARWTALVYRMDVDDEIDFDVRTFSYGNIGESTHTGVELDLEQQTRGVVRPTVSYSFTKVSARDDGRQLKNVPRHRAAVGAWAELPWAVGVHGRVSKTTGAFLDDENQRPLGGATTLDVRVRRPWGRTVVVLDVFNATNHRFADYGFTLADFSGRTVGYVYPGAPRAWRVGVIRSF